MFSREQCTWITLEYAKNSSPTKVKRKFVRKYNICGRQKSKYCPHHFTRVFERFKSRGIAPALYLGSQISKATPQANQLISQEIQENSTSSIRQIARKLDFSKATTRKILRKELKVKPSKKVSKKVTERKTNSCKLRPQSSPLHSLQWCSFRRRNVIGYI